MDWSPIKQEAITHLQNLIRINTTNPPGNELEALQYIARILEQEQIPYQIFESAPNRGNLIARLKGKGTRRPLMLTSHVDVVPAEKKYWDLDPFSGAIKDNCIWGRGAVDMKQMVVMELMMLLLAKRQSLNLPRDLIYAVVSDEETGCHLGSQWLVENKSEFLNAEYALNEVGAFSLPIDNHVFYPIGVGERGICWFKIIAKGDPGHGSLPHNNQAVVKLARIALRLGQNKLPFHLPPLSRQFISTLAAYQKFPKSWVLKSILNRGLSSFILNHVIPDKKNATSFHALLHNTATPTIFSAGNKVNVIPGQAELHVDGRIIPGETVESFVNEIKNILDDQWYKPRNLCRSSPEPTSVGDDFEIEIIRSKDPPPVLEQDNFYQLLAKTITEHDNQGIPVPYLMPGFTDASYYSQLGIKCFGFSPIQLDKGIKFSELFHGHNERIPINGFLFGIKVLWDVICHA